MLKIKVNSNNKAITLISLVMTIIIMLILIGITLNLTLGENGLLKKAKEGKEKQIRAEILEELELAKGPIMIENEGITDLDVYLETIKDKKLRNKYEITSINYIDEINAEILVDGKYEYTATQKGIDVIINELGYIKEIVKPIITVEDEEKWTNQKKNISITTSKYVTKYTTDGTMPSENNGTIYTEPFSIDKNCVITAAYLDSKNKKVSSTTKEITKIDKISPSVLNINLTPNKKSIKVDIINAEDGNATSEDGKSGIAEYRYKRDSGAWSNWTTESTYKFDNIYGDLTGVTCTITVETRDYAGNTKPASKTAKTTCLNTTYYKNYPFNMCTLNGRTYRKLNSEGSIHALMYYRNSGEWANALSVGLTKSSVANNCTAFSNEGAHDAWTINYKGTIYYISHTHGLPTNCTINSISIPILNSKNDLYSNSSVAAEVLLNRYFQE